MEGLWGAEVGGGRRSSGEGMVDTKAHRAQKKAIEKRARKTDAVENVIVHLFSWKFCGDANEIR